MTDTDPTDTPRLSPAMRGDVDGRINSHVERAYHALILALDSARRELAGPDGEPLRNACSHIDWPARTAQLANLSEALEALDTYRAARGLPRDRAYHEHAGDHDGQRLAWRDIAADVAAVFESVRSGKFARELD